MTNLPAFNTIYMRKESKTINAKVPLIVELLLVEWVGLVGTEGIMKI